MAFQESKSHCSSWIRNPRVSGFLIHAREGKERQGKHSGERELIVRRPYTDIERVSNFKIQRNE